MVRHALILLLLAFSLRVEAVTSTKTENTEGPLLGQVVSVHDGATLTVLIDGRNEEVRLLGVDAPELDQWPWGPRARNALALIVEGKQVKLETDITVRDQEQRLLAYVYVDDVFVNQEMLWQGHAMLSAVPPNVARVGELQKAQEEARKKGRGVWDPTHPLTVSPDCHRKEQERREC
jgi:micrococcal nuclease